MKKHLFQYSESYVYNSINKYRHCSNNYLKKSLLNKKILNINYKINTIIIALIMIIIK